MLGARQVRPASAHVVNATTDYACGLVCPLLLPESLPMFIDDRLLADNEPLFTATGERHTALSMRSLDLLAVLPGKMVDLRGSRRRGPRAAVARRH
ncbi:aminoacyl-tRNA deacylase [Nonomuraea thailandensis]